MNTKWDEILLTIQLDIEFNNLEDDVIDAVREAEELADWLNGESPEYSDKWMVE